MKVGVLQFFGWRDRSIPLEDVYRRALERIKIMDQTGYDAVWLAEHHFSSYSVCPSVHMMGMHVAGITKNIRIGTAVTLAAFYHPLRIAEEVALLDMFSDGRVNWGAGRGFDPVEMSVFGVQPKESTERFREAVEIVLQAWSSERLTFKGKFHSYEEVEVLPKPRQRPHPPAWVAASSQGAVEWAAGRGLSILMDPHSEHGEIARKRSLFQSVLEKAGHTIKGRDLPTARLMAIADTDEEAAAVASRGAYFTSRYVPKQAIASFRSDGRMLEPEEHYMDDVIIHGSPERVVDTLKRLEEEIPLDYLLLSPLSDRTFELFTEKVLPHVIG
jgi:alkanesulfonate monooxygenase SsuD/methylene tetrahydromethanopterin reductase-like flavin-dependent oxidoreductase (luciferase family)